MKSNSNMKLNDKSRKQCQYIVQQNYYFQLETKP